MKTMPMMHIPEAMIGTIQWIDLWEVQAKKKREAGKIVDPIRHSFMNMETGGSCPGEQGG